MDTTSTLAEKETQPVNLNQPTQPETCTQPTQPLNCLQPTQPENLGTLTQSVDGNETHSVDAKRRNETQSVDGSTLA
eukprot:CAMPEP_0198222838 /NCGR_PEP_ID=MMETSP1445-20131203/89934_1 /TAXON_ID=36898 /ORGANISM="Pyramimonas sp., Strain CCMP2087" /LENGTH=76 /DNA_ID=CAMNT_0043901495 /DNA_START=278 /DNA_END=505 /DNA_ORIENTATION=-